MKLPSILLCCALALWIPSGAAKKAVPQQSTAPIAQSADISAVEVSIRDRIEADYGKRLSEERAILERQNDRQFSSLEKLIDRALWVFGIIFIFASGAFAFFFGKSWIELKASLRQVFENQASKVLDEQATQLRDRYQALQREVDALRSYKDRNITWVLPVGGEPTSSVITALNAAGLRSPAILVPEDTGDFQIGDPDLVILTYDGSNDSKIILATICDQLKRKSPPLPFLIYSFDPNGAPARLEDAEFNAMRGFDWFVPVNFPAQLLAQAQLLIRQDRRALGGGHG